MAVFRVEKNKNYTVMSNYHLNDKSLTLNALTQIVRTIQETPLLQGKGITQTGAATQAASVLSLTGTVRDCRNEYTRR